MKKSSKFVFLGMIAILLASMVGCQPAAPAAPAEQPAATEAPAAEKVTVRVLGMQQAGYPVDIQNEIMAAFNAENPGIEVVGEYVAYEALHDKISTSMAVTPPAYDVMLIDDIWYAEFSQAGYLMDATDRITQEMKDGIFTSGWEITTVAGKTYGMPWGIDGMYFYYNQKMLADAGFAAPPATWEELAEMGKVLQEKGLVEYPLVWSWAQAEASICTLVALLFGNGGTFVDDQGNAAFNNADGIEVVQWMVELDRQRPGQPGLDFLPGRRCAQCLLAGQGSLRHQLGLYVRPGQSRPCRIADQRSGRYVCDAGLQKRPG